MGKQQMSAHFLLTACEKIDPEFPVVMETYREIMEDYMDVQNATELVERIKDEDMTVTAMQMDLPSPFAHQMLLQGESDVLLMENRKKRIQEMHRLVIERIDRERPLNENWRKEAESEE